MDKIEELREKVEKDPDSKLFVPLAEEYRKAGMLDEAIEVLKKGIERQPSYVSARVTLGKIYLDKGMHEDAEHEFKTVVDRVPDNLYAQRKLADIYREKGEREHAAEQYRRVLKLNPMDEEAQNILQEISKAPPPAEEATAAIEGPGTIGEEDYLPEDEDFLLSLSGSEADYLGEEEFTFLAEEAAPEDEFLEAVDEASDEEEFLEAIEGEEQGLEALETVEEAPPGEIEEVEAAVVEESTPEVVAEAKEEGAPAEGPEPVSDFEDVVIGEPAAIETEEEERKLMLAQEYVSKGEYSKALNIYKGVIERDPDNKKALQGLQELEALIKLLGKEKEVIIAKLEAFLNAILERRDEFHKYA